MSETYLKKLHREHLERKLRIFGPSQRQFIRPKRPEPTPPPPPPPKMENVHVLLAPPLAVRVTRGTNTPWAVMERIAKEVALKWGKSLADIRALDRRKEFSIPRAEFCYRVIQETTLSYASIGRYLGGRDHTTILSAAHKHQSRHPELPEISRLSRAHRRPGLPWRKGLKGIGMSNPGQGDPEGDNPLPSAGDPLPGQKVDPCEVVQPSVPGNMGDEDDPHDFGKPKRPVDPSEVVQPGGPGNMGDE